MTASLSNFSTTAKAKYIISISFLYWLSYAKERVILEGSIYVKYAPPFFFLQVTEKLFKLGEGKWGIY